MRERKETIHAVYRNKFTFNKMQRYLAISFIIILALSQYAGQLRYLQCRLVSNFSSNGGEHCDCEKQNIAKQPTGKEFPVTQTSSHADVDEFYMQAKADAALSSVSLMLPRLFLRYNSTTCKGSYGKLYKPPRS